MGGFSRPTRASPAERPAGRAVVGTLVRDVVNSRGSPLPGGVRAEMESRLGHHFSDVRIHTDRSAAAASEALDAAAFSSGSEIGFAAGQFAPHTRAGSDLLAHELAHVVQQRAGPVDGTMLAGSGLIVSDPADRSERAATAAARLDKPARLLVHELAHALEQQRSGQVGETVKPASGSVVSATLDRSGRAAELELRHDTGQLPEPDLSNLQVPPRARPTRWTTPERTPSTDLPPTPAAAPVPVVVQRFKNLFFDPPTDIHFGVISRMSLLDLTELAGLIANGRISPTEEELSAILSRLAEIERERTTAQREQEIERERTIAQLEQEIEALELEIEQEELEELEAARREIEQRDRIPEPPQLEPSDAKPSLTELFDAEAQVKTPTQAEAAQGALAKDKKWAEAVGEELDKLRGQLKDAVGPGWDLLDASDQGNAVIEIRNRLFRQAKDKPKGTLAKGRAKAKSPAAVLCENFARAHPNLIADLAAPLQAAARALHAEALAAEKAEKDEREASKQKRLAKKKDVGAKKREQRRNMPPLAAAPPPVAVPPVVPVVAPPSVAGLLALAGDENRCEQFAEMLGRLVDNPAFNVSIEKNDRHWPNPGFLGPSDQQTVTAWFVVHDNGRLLWRDRFPVTFVMHYHLDGRDDADPANAGTQSKMHMKSYDRAQPHHRVRWIHLAHSILTKVPTFEEIQDDFGKKQ